jgi:DNA-binding protein H-NS
MAYNTSEISQLLQKQAELDTAIAETRARETRLALIDIVQKMREYDISLNELVGRSSAEQRLDVHPKYRDPVSGATWSGRGRAPQWIVGQDRDQFLTAQGGDAHPQLQATLFPDLR